MWRVISSSPPHPYGALCSLWLAGVGETVLAHSEMLQASCIEQWQVEVSADLTGAASSKLAETSLLAAAFCSLEDCTGLPGDALGKPQRAAEGELLQASQHSL